MNCLAYLILLLPPKQLSVYDHIERILIRWDVIRHVDSDIDPVTGEDRVWHVFEAGDLPSSLEDP